MQTKNEAIVAYLKAQSKVHGLGSVILLPEFTGSDDNGWTPVEGNGVRSTKKEGTSFIRLGSVVLGDGLKVTVRYTNDFLPTEDLLTTLDMLCVVPGGKVPGKLIAHERMEPFSKTNSARDIKWADQKANLACMVDDQPIYRRIEHTTNMSKEDITIQHTNGAAISANASAKWAATNKSVTPGLAEAAATRKAELAAK